jgi:hypothetical protein
MNKNEFIMPLEDEKKFALEQEITLRTYKISFFGKEIIKANIIAIKHPITLC